MLNYAPWIVPEEGIWGVYRNITHPLQEAITIIEANGVFVDRESLLKYAKDYTARIQEAEIKFYEMAGRRVDWGSSDKLREFLYDELGIKPVRWTDTGAPSADQKALQKLKNAHRCIPVLLDLKELSTAKQNYLDGNPGLLPFIKEDGRVRTNYRVDGTETGRLSSTKPNVHNIARGSDLIKEVGDIRAMFHPAPGNVWVEADYSQLELRIIAILSGDENMLAAFASGRDFHQATAAFMFKVAFEDVTKEERSKAKAVNFGIVYGIGAYSLGFDLDISKEEAQEYIDLWFSAYPKVRRWLRNTEALAAKQGYLDNIFGRRRHLLELKYPFTMNAEWKKRFSHHQRAAKNFPVQSIGSDFLSLATISLVLYPFDEFTETRAFPIMTLHDALFFECPVETAESAALIIKEVMQNLPLEVAGERWALPVDVKIGKYWGDEEAVVLH